MSETPVATTSRPVAPQYGPQTYLLSCPADEIFFGGARGGGKSYGVLLDWLWHHERYPGLANGVVFRRSMPELEEIQREARGILPLFGFRYFRQGTTWRHANGGTLKMRHLDRDEDADLYQGHSYNWLGFDEAGSWPRMNPINMLRATLRDVRGVPVRMILTGNPGGRGHNWLKARYVDPAPPMTMIAEVSDDVEWRRVFIPSRVEDNQLLLHNDPGYVARIKQSGPEWLVNAWLDGNWDIVAGGAFDDVWQRDRHVIPPFEIPKGWYVDRSFDWGSSRPFSVGWWAESDGSEATMPDGTTRSWPRGTLFRIAEWYGWNGTPNEGIRMTAREIARGIRDREKSISERVSGRIHPGPADSSIFSTENGNSIAGDMETAGVTWQAANKAPGSRKLGWERMRGLLSSAMQSPQEKPGLFVFENCSQFIRTVPVLPCSERDPEDVDTDSEDHVADEARYRVLSMRPVARRVKVKGV